jgi:POT family proton-dependent oligopeptide transporter
MSDSEAAGLAENDLEPVDSQSDTRGIGGHPAGLTPLFFTEMWERFSYYGMRAILMLYMVAKPEDGGLGFSYHDGGNLYGNYTMAVYIGAIPGGYVSDRYLGSRLAILIGGIIIALGHFTLAFRELPFFYAGLGLIVLGTGFLKPNMSTMVGKLYSKNDSRRDAGFSIYYMGINIGAGLSPLICGFLAQAEPFKKWLKSVGLNPNDSWHWGFAAAGVGMTIGLIHYVLQAKVLGNIGMRPSKKHKTFLADQPGVADPVEEPTATDGPLTKTEWLKLGALAILFCFNILFWAIYEQGGSSLNLFADKLTDCRIFGVEFPSSWFQSVNAVFIIIFAPLFSFLWIKLGKNEPSSPAKFAWGLGLLAAAIAVMVPASMLAGHGKVSIFWLTLCYLLNTWAELCLSPVGLSTVTKLAPPKIAAMIMGCWFLSYSIGNRAAGYLAGFFNDKDINALIYLYGGMAGMAALSALSAFLLLPTIRKLMVDVK